MRFRKLSDWHPDPRAIQGIEPDRGDHDHRRDSRRTCLKDGQPTHPPGRWCNRRRREGVETDGTTGQVGKAGQTEPEAEHEGFRLLKLRHRRRHLNLYLFCGTWAGDQNRCP